MPSPQMFTATVDSAGSHVFRNVKDVTVDSGTTINSSGITTTSDFSNPGAGGVMLYLSVSAADGSAAHSPTLDITLQGKDAVTGNYFAIPGAAFTQVGGATDTQTLYVHPNSPDDSGTAYRRRPGPITSTWRLQYSAQSMSSANDGSSYTFTIGGTYIP